MSKRTALSHLCVQLAVIDEQYMTLPFGGFVVGGDPDESLDAGVVEHPFWQSDDGFEPVVFTLPAYAESECYGQQPDENGGRNACQYSRPIVLRLHQHRE